MDGKVFGSVLKLVRSGRNISQEKLAELCDLDRTYISLLERGLRQPSLTTIFKLCEALEIKPSELLSIIEKRC